MYYTFSSGDNKLSEFLWFLAAVKFKRELIIQFLQYAYCAQYAQFLCMAHMGQLSTFIKMWSTQQSTLSQILYPAMQCNHFKCDKLYRSNINHDFSIYLTILLKIETFATQTRLQLQHLYFLKSNWMTFDESRTVHSTKIWSSFHMWFVRSN